MRWIYIPALWLSLCASATRPAPNGASTRPAEGSPTTFREILATRAAPDLRTLAERSDPNRTGPEASESFYDILKLREIRGANAVPVLEKILADHPSSHRIHRFAAAQALFCIDTPAAHKVLSGQLHGGRYPAKSGIGYTFSWEMAEPRRSRFIERYLLANDANDLVVGLEANAISKEGRIDFTITLRNVSEKAFRIRDRETYIGDMLYFRSAAGRYMPSLQTVRYDPLMPKWVELKPGEKRQWRVSARSKPAPAIQGSWLPRDTTLVLETPDVRHYIDKPGRFDVVAMFEVALTKGQALQAKIDNLWSGRAVSKPVQVEIVGPDVRATTQPAPSAGSGQAPNVASTQAADLSKAAAAGSAAVKALADALMRDMAKAIAEHKGLTPMNAAGGKQGDAMFCRVDYFHNCSYWGKQGWKDGGDDAIGIMFNLARPDVLDKVEAQDPAHRWKNLDLIGWDYRHYGKEVPPELRRKIDNLLSSCLAAIDQQDRDAGPATQPATGPAPSASSGQATQPTAGPAEIERLIRQLADETSPERDAAQQALVKIGSPAVLPLARAMRDRDPEVASRAKSILVAGGPRTAWELCKARTHPDAEVRACVQAALAAIAQAHTPFELYLWAADSLKAGGSRRAVAEQLRMAAERDPNEASLKRHGLSELAENLLKMADEDDAFKEPKDPAALEGASRIEYLTFKLRDVAAEDPFVPGKVQIFLFKRDNAAWALRRLGKQAVPTLIGMLEDRRPTRSVGNPMNGGYILRYGDVALQTIEAIAARRFDTRSSRGAYLTNADEPTRKAIIAKVTAWWDEHHDQNEAQWIRAGLAEAGLGSMWDSIGWAKRLIELEGPKSADVFRALVAREPETPWPLILLHEAGGKAVLEDIRRAAKDKSIRVRATAYGILRGEGEPGVVDMALTDLAGMKELPETSRFGNALLEFLAGSDDDRAVLAVARLMLSPQKHVVVDAREATLQANRADKITPRRLRMILPYVAATLNDQKREAGYHLRAAQWIIEAAELPIGWPTTGAAALYDQAVSKVKAWWEAHRQEYPEVNASPASLPAGDPATHGASTRPAETSANDAAGVSSLRNARGPRRRTGDWLAA